MASERALKCAREWLPDCKKRDCPCEGPSQLRLADLIDRHFHVHPPGKEAETAAVRIMQQAEVSGSPQGLDGVRKMMVDIIASAYADRLAKYEAVCEFVTKISTLEWVMTEEGAAKLRKLLAALREDKA